MEEVDAIFTLEDPLGVSSLQFDRDSSTYSSRHAGSRVDTALPTLRVRSDLMVATSDTMAGDYGFLPGFGTAEEDDRFLEDVDFEFDANGEMREITTPQIPAAARNMDSMTGGRTGSIGPSRMGRAWSVQSAGRGSRMNSEEAAAQVLREHEEGRDGSYNKSHAVNSTFRRHILGY